VTCRVGFWGRIGDAELGKLEAESGIVLTTVGTRILEATAMQLTDRHRQYWQKNLRITGILLGIWFVVTFVSAYFARDLSFSFFGWPFSFWVASQGALVVYVVIIGYYAHYMNKLDNEFGVAETEED
jgi:putative solute:sodium symporter small subunit